MLTSSRSRRRRSPSLPFLHVFLFMLLTALLEDATAALDRDSDNYYRYHLVEDHHRVQRDTGTAGASSSSSAEPPTSSTGAASNAGSPTPFDAGSGRGWIGDGNRGAQVLGNVAVDIPDELIKDSLKNHSIDEFDQDDHKYYRSQFFNGGDWWVDMELLNKTHKGIVREHSMLSKSYRRAATVQLTFIFPFYGHNVSNITIATGGFLYTGDYVHSWLAATQYIAPLMANFDTSKSDGAKILYADNGTALIVEWENVFLQVGGDQGSTTELDVPKQHYDVMMSSPFTFQAILHKSGDIVFVYKSVPVTITSIEDKQHPVKVGLSDAYIIDRVIFFARRKTIYEYHRVDMKEKAAIANHTAIYFKALPTCIGQTHCETCIKTVDETNVSLNCMWCSELGRCSDGMDRFRQKWLLKSCDTFHVKAGDYNACKAVQVYHGNGSYNRPEENTRTDRPPSSSSEGDGGGKEMKYDPGTSYSDDSSDDGVEKEKLSLTTQSYHHVGIVAVSIVAVVVVTLFGWFAYAYLFPHSTSGQLLIRYRPTRWQWRSEPRYTAASIHM